MGRKSFKKIIFILSIFFISFAVISLFFAPDVRADEMQELKKRVNELEEHQGELYHSLKEKKRPGHKTGISDRISFGGLVEVELSQASGGPDSETSSDIVAATVELSVDAEINDSVNAHVLLLWEEDDTDPIAMDEATIEVTSPYGLVITGGKMYVPFGVFNSHFVSDPITLELGETNESAILVSYETGIFSGSVGIFNGDIDSNKENVIDDFVLSVTATPMKDLTVGVSYITDIAEGDIGLTTNPDVDSVGGIGLSATYVYDRFTIEFEYVGALEDFNVNDLNDDGDGNGDRPSAFNLEVAYQLNDKTEIAGKYESSSEMFDQPESQVGAVASYELFPHTAVAIEYLFGEYDSSFATAGAEDRHLLTGQIAVEF